VEEDSRGNISRKMRKRSWINNNPDSPEWENSDILNIQTHTLTLSEKHSLKATAFYLQRNKCTTRKKHSTSNKIVSEYFIEEKNSQESVEPVFKNLYFCSKLTIHLSKIQSGV